MTALGHEVIHYGHEESDLVCTEHVTVLSTEDWKRSYGDHDWRKHFFKFDMKDHAYLTFYDNAIREVGKRKKPGDFLLAFWGFGHKPICDVHSDMKIVEPGIGYAGGHFAPFKVFESYAIYHAYYGLEAVGICKQNTNDVVIPNYFDLEDFTFKDTKRNFFLFLGRVYEGKGVQIAIETTRRLGAKLVIAGQGTLPSMPDHVQHVGYADVNMRKELLSQARALFVPSQYLEPFGGVQVEGLLSGTPTITSDWGAFTENNIQGVTGFRCMTLDDYLEAAKNIDQISPSACRTFAEKNFSLEAVGLRYERYFQRI